MEKIIKILKSPRTYMVLLTVAQLYGALKLFNGVSAISHNSKIAHQIMIDQAVRLGGIDCQARDLIIAKELNDASLLNGSVIEKSAVGLSSFILLITICCFISIFFYFKRGRIST